MPPSPKQPIGKIALAVGVAVIALLTIWLVVANPFSGGDETENPVLADTQEEKVIKDPVVEKNKSDKSNEEEFASFDSPAAEPDQFNESYSDAPNSSDSSFTEDTSYKTTENQTNNTVVIEDQSPPESPTIVAGPKGLTNDRSPVFKFKGAKSARFRCSLNQEGYKNSKGCDATKGFKNLARGKKYTLRVWQVDIFGQRSYGPAKRNFTVKAKPLPTVKLLSYPKKWTNASSYSFSFKGVSGASFVCSINSSSVSGAEPCGSPKVYRDLSDGRYVFRVWQKKAGAVSKAAKKYDFNVDRTAPAPPTITAGPEGETSDTEQVFSFSGESGARFSCAILPASPLACSSPATYALSLGDYTFAVYQTDRAGNRSLSPAERSFSVIESDPLVSASGRERGLQGFETDSPSENYVPTNQETSEDTTFTVDVLAAIELSDPADDSDAVAPVAGGASNVTADLDMAAELRSNLSWSITSSTVGSLTGGSTGSRDLLNDLTGDGVGVDSGNRNNSNTAQSVDADYNQDVSWGDEAGRYTEVITHTASQTLSP